MNQANDKKAAQLLINNYEDIGRLNKMILEAPYQAQDLDTPVCRFRGSLVDSSGGSNRIKLVGWQRNIARMRKMDVSLPTIITLTVNDGVIEDINLDASFKGSKGLMCSWKYLNRNLKSLFEGQVFDPSFIQKAKLESTHCFHLFEVLGGLYSYYQILQADDFREIAPDHRACMREIAYEEEAIDSYVENGTIHSLGTQLLKGKAPLHFELILHQILHQVSYEKNGKVKTEQGIQADFLLNDLVVLTETITLNNPIPGSIDLSHFLFRCIRQLKQRLCPNQNGQIYNTNLYPQAYIGMLIQSLAIRLFNNNYNYIMHALTALQRSDTRPLCVGAIKDQNEANQYFPGYSFAELI
ncbi:MAG TPA: hypothetical protein VHY08_03590 [Bacillota bacterium]|nr:hypothetical protein [Bacillota bacterium]